MPSAWWEENKGMDCSGVGMGIVNPRLNMVAEWNVCFLVKSHVPQQLRLSYQKTESSVSFLG